MEKFSDAHYMPLSREMDNKSNNLTFHEIICSIIQLLKQAEHTDVKGRKFAWIFLLKH